MRNKSYNYLIISFFIFFLLQTGLLLAQEEMVLQSEHLPDAATVWVFLPDDATPNEQFPAVYMLHGWSGDYKQWSNIIDLQDYANTYDFVIICPDGLYDSWYLNSPVKAEWQYETFFFNDLMPAIEERFPVNSNQVFITGLSMGGHGAMYLFLRHHERFVTAGSSSGVLSLHASSLRTSSIPKLLGSYSENKARFDEFSAVSQLENIENTDIHIIFDCGTEDHLYEANNAFRARCDALHINATYISQPGSHNSAYWRHAIKAHFEFFKAALE